MGRKKPNQKKGEGEDNNPQQQHQQRSSSQQGRGQQQIPQAAQQQQQQGAVPRQQQQGPPGFAQQQQQVSRQQQGPSGFAQQQQQGAAPRQQQQGPPGFAQQRQQQRAVSRQPPSEGESWPLRPQQLSQDDFARQQRDASMQREQEQPRKQQSELGQQTPILQTQQQASKGAGKVKDKYAHKKADRPATAPTAQPLPTVDPRANSSDSALNKEFSTMQLSPTKSLAMIESSPNGTIYQGTRGKVCQLEVNYLQLLVNKLIPTAYHYDVSFDPNASKKMWPSALDNLMNQYFRGVHFAFDGRANFYTNQLLKIKNVVLDGSLEQEVEAVLGDRTRKFKVKIQFAAEVDLNVLKAYQQPALQHNDKPSRAIQCLDIILRTAFKPLTENNKATAVGRALYFANEQRQKLDLGEGMELWLGLFQSAILGRRSLYLNVDVAHKAFPSAIRVLDVVSSFDREGRVPAKLDERSQRKLNDYLKMLSISYENKTFGYNAMVKSAREALFVKEDGSKMSVLDYFRREKRTELKFPDLPCLHVGSRTRNIYLPMELCSIPAGQATNKKCTPNAVAAMIKFSATSTEMRKAKIQALLNKITYSAPGSVINGFGIDVGKDFQKVEGRIIDPPSIQYQRGSVRPSRGVWDDRNQKFIQTQQNQVKWGIINCDNRTTSQTINELQRNISKKASEQGMNMTPFDMNRDYATHNMMGQYREADLIKLLDDYYQQGYRLVFVIIIDMNDCYAKFKQAAELKVGILTQCIKANTIFRMGKGNPMMTIGNIMLKVNAKLGGKNHEVIETSYQAHNAANNGIMFVGADVTHPGPDCRDLPSVVGVAASYDPVGFRYNCAWRLQKPTQEMIVDLADILTTQLQFYKQKNGKLPGKIMYYRDGVSDGQFEEVLRIEMTAIRKAIQTVYRPEEPKAKVTFVVVQKRHHTRFFPTQKQFTDGKNNNIPAGTVVDKDIVHPFQYQFFMASHAAIQGVTKPAKYCVLVNESKISPDDLQAITYDLCHLFTRCNRSVSYPAPTYYAHLVAARGKNYTIGKRLNMDKLPEEYARMLIRPEIVNNNPMFFV